MLKSTLEQVTKDQSGGKKRYSYTLSLTTSALDRGGWSLPRSDRFTSRKETRATAGLEGYVKFPPPPPTGIRLTDHSARSQSLYNPLYLDSYSTGNTFNLAKRH